MTTTRFRAIIRGYYRKHGRRLPWRETRDPYAILVSEIMLQQTQVERVIGYYEKFLKRFPDFRSLAKAKTRDVLAAWQGLGYNRRALALQKLSKIVLEKFNGQLPQERAVLESLPGIGKGTSGALRAFAFNKPEVFIETNIRRVFIHFFFPRKSAVTDEALARYIKRTLDAHHPREWYWALMDYGSFMKTGMSAPFTRGASYANPNRRSAHYKKQSTFRGSDRELRGKILRLAIAQQKIEAKLLPQILNASAARAQKIAITLCHEGFIKKKGNYYHAH